MTKPREWDCGCWDTPYDHNRLVIRERPDGLYDLLHIRYTRTREGMQKIESPCGVYRELNAAKTAGWTLWRQLSDIG